MLKPLVKRPVRDSEVGQSTAEYAAVIVAAVILVLALIVMASPWGRQLVCVVSSAIDRVGGGSGYSCGDAGGDHDGDPEAGTRPEPTEPCAMSENSREKIVSGTFFITVEGGGRIMVEEMSDGTYRVTETGILGANYDFTSPGVTVEGTYDDQTWGGSVGGKGKDKGGKSEGKGGASGAGGGANLGLGGEVSRTFVVNSEEEKNSLVNYLQNQVDNRTLTMASPISGLAKQGWDWAWDNNGARTYNPPGAAEYTVQAGADGSLNGSLDAGVVNLEAKGNASRALGATYHTNDGSMTVYYKAEMRADASGNMSFVAGTVEPTAKAEGGAESIIAVTLDKDGKPKDMKLTTAVDGKVSGSIESVFTKDDPSLSVGGGKIYEHTIDMTNPQSALKGYDLALAAGIPIYGAGATLVGHNPVAEFVQEAQANGTATLRDFDRDSTTNWGFNISAKGDGFNVGAAYSDESTSKKYSNPKYWNGSRYADWKKCQGR